VALRLKISQVQITTVFKRCLFVSFEQAKSHQILFAAHVTGAAYLPLSPLLN
jgi:hypothetical protein